MVRGAFTEKTTSSQGLQDERESEEEHARLREQHVQRPCGSRGGGSRSGCSGPAGLDSEPGKQGQ